MDESIELSWAHVESTELSTVYRVVVVSVGPVELAPAVHAQPYALLQPLVHVAVAGVDLYWPIKNRGKAGGMIVFHEILQKVFGENT